MKKLRILVDYDEVLNNLLDGWVEYLNEKHGLNAKAEDIDEWDVGCVYPTLSAGEVEAPLHDDAIWDRLTPRQHSVEYLKKMIDDGHEVFIATAASVYHTLPSKIDWLLRNYPYLSWKNVVIASTKQIISADVLIDDASHNLEGGSYHKIMFDCYNNRQYPAEANGMQRVYSLKEAYEIIKKLSEE